MCCIDGAGAALVVAVGTTVVAIHTFAFFDEVISSTAWLMTLINETESQTALIRAHSLGVDGG